MHDPYLEHHGVKGMHWGVRKDRDSDKTSSGEPVLTEHAARHNELISRYKKHGADALSNEDLKFMATRSKNITNAENSIPKSWSEKHIKTIPKATFKTIGRIGEVASGAAFTAFIFTTLGKEYIPGVGSLMPSNNEIARFAGRHGSELGSQARKWLLS